MDSQWLHISSINLINTSAEFFKKDVLSSSPIVNLRTFQSLAFWSYFFFNLGIRTEHCPDGLMHITMTWQTKLVSFPPQQFYELVSSYKYSEHPRYPGNLSGASLCLHVSMVTPTHIISQVIRNKSVYYVLNFLKKNSRCACMYFNCKPSFR